ncbi:alpha/beta hydrolase family protein [Candidatus Protochlamydia phocaeensis]|uniref:alpha/beta hydrolase family protein n=1 Tax=Candidatus Protochlamydia phocaeensis TaxID=1414722 RepID=UPI0008394E47|nr:alpha/beta fold hydrolase [Candidatus Protochlamydia phocaeensis]
MIFSLLHPGQNIGQFIVPNQRRLLSQEEISRHEHEAAQMVADFEGERIEDVRVDAGALEAFYFSGLDSHTHQKVDRAGETVILFVGQGAYHYWYSYLVDKYTKRGINVVSFNYPGVAHSEGEAAKEKMVKAGEALVDYLERHLGVPRQKIAVHGHSLGGGPSALTAVSRPGIHVVNKRSFAKLSLAAENFVRGALPANNLARSVFNTLGRNATRLALTSTNWEFDTEAAWPRIQGRKCVVCHLNDPVIPKEASLYQAIQGRDNQTQCLVLDDECQDPHSRQLSDQEIDAVVQAIGFRNLLLAPPAVNRIRDWKVLFCEWIGGIKARLISLVQFIANRLFNSNRPLVSQG